MADARDFEGKSTYRGRARPFGRKRAGRWCGMPRMGASVLRRAVAAEFFEIVHQAVELPLDVDLHGTAQGRAVHALLRGEVTEDRLDDAEPPAVNLPAGGDR